MPIWSRDEADALAGGWSYGRLAATLPVDCPHCIHANGRAFEDVVVPGVIVVPGGGGVSGGAPDVGDAGPRGGGLDGGRVSEGDDSFDAEVVGYPSSYLVTCQCHDEEHGSAGGCGASGPIRIPGRVDR